MSNYKNKVLDLVQQRPGVRVFQISDKLDLDVDIVESILAQAIREEVIGVDVIEGANGLPTKTYRWTGAASQAPGKKDEVATDQPEVKHAAATAPVAGAPAAPAKSTARLPAGPSKASIAIDYLELNGPTDRTTLMKVMGLPKEYAIEQFLKPHIKNGKIVRIADVYCIPDRSAAAPAAATAIAADKPAAPAPADAAVPVPVADPVHALAHYTAGGMEVVDILRAKLTPEEFRGFLKGNAIRYMLDAEHKGGAQDYKKGCTYATWLAQATAQQPAGAGI